MIDTSLDSINFYLLFAVFQGVLLSVIIAFQKPRPKASILFSILLFLLSLATLHLLLEASIAKFNLKFPIPLEFTLAYGPLSYFHLKLIKNPVYSFKSIDLLHFLPSFLIDGVLFFAFFLFSQDRPDWRTEHIDTIRTVSISIALAGSMQLILYTYLLYKESKRALPLLKDFNEVRKWVKQITIAWTILVSFLVIVLPLVLLNINLESNYIALILQSQASIIGIFIFSLGFLYLLKYSKKIKTYAEKVKRFSFSEEELKLKKAALLEGLEKEKWYLNPTISLTQLAGYLGWPINTVSQLINDYLGTNFNDLINSYRIKAFQKLIDDKENQKYSISGLGEKVGFRSKASFYRAFKKETGLTPSMYINSQAAK